jgi:hypothetical protein
MQVSLYILNTKGNIRYIFNNFLHADSAAVAICAAALIQDIVHGNGDASDSSDEVARLADAGKLIPVQRIAVLNQLWLFILQHLQPFNSMHQP